VILTKAPWTTAVRWATIMWFSSVAASLNDRPRKTLGFMKPSENLAELLAHTA
jgi:IS30 family transposase